MHYIELIRTQGRLPLAAEGFQTYHPPLYHALTAAVVAVFGSGPESASASVAYRVVSTLSGLACVVFAGLTARRIWPDDDARVAVATVFAAVVPVGVYTAAYLGNESFHAACVSGALFVATRICTEARTRTSDVAWLGALLSMALLTKFTALALAPLIVVCVMAKRFWLEGPMQHRRAMAPCTARVAAPSRPGPPSRRGSRRRADGSIYATSSSTAIPWCGTSTSPARRHGGYSRDSTPLRGCSSAKACAPPLRRLPLVVGWRVLDLLGRWPRGQA